MKMILLMKLHIHTYKQTNRQGVLCTVQGWDEVHANTRIALRTKETGTPPAPSPLTGDRRMQKDALSGKSAICAMNMTKRGEKWGIRGIPFDGQRISTPELEVGRYVLEP